MSILILDLGRVFIQLTESPKKKVQNSGITVNGFTYHQNAIKKGMNMRYLMCSEFKRLVCKARATLPLNSSVDKLVITNPHNHPPFQQATIKDIFLKEIRDYINSQPGRPLKQIYEDISILQPEAAELFPFSRLHPSMRRWRSKALKKEYIVLTEANMESLAAAANTC